MGHPELPSGTRPIPPVRDVIIGVALCLPVALAVAATLNEPGEPEPLCWYE